jgi:hypothetical protein
MVEATWPTGWTETIFGAGSTQTLASPRNAARKTSGGSQRSSSSWATPESSAPAPSSHRTQMTARWPETSSLKQTSRFWRYTWIARSLSPSNEIRKGFTSALETGRSNISLALTTRTRCPRSQKSSSIRASSPLQSLSIKSSPTSKSMNCFFPAKPQEISFLKIVTLRSCDFSSP